MGGKINTYLLIFRHLFVFLLQPRKNTSRTIIIEAELDSLSVFESIPEKMGVDPEMQELAPKLGAIVDTVEFELYIPM